MNQLNLKIADLNIRYVVTMPIKLSASLRIFESVFDQADIICYLCFQNELNKISGEILKKIEIANAGEIRIFRVNKNLYQITYPDSLRKVENFFSSESFAGYIGLEFILMDHHAFFLHASLIMLKGNGIIFSASSGTGKSTQAKLWEKYENAKILNGDRALIKEYVEDGEIKYKVYGSPFAGSSYIYQNIGCHLKTICLIEKSKKDTIAVCRPSIAFIRLFGESLQVPDNLEYQYKLHQLITRLVGHSMILEFKCTKSKSAVFLLKHYLEDN